MSTSVYFNGELLTIPGAYSKIDTSLMNSKTDEGAKIIAIVGESKGGEPSSIQFLSDPASAKKILKGGDLLKACQKAWNPVSKSKQGVPTGGANIIAAIRTNAATKSSTSLKNSENKEVIAFQSKDWGDDTCHQIKIQDGTLSRTKKITIYDQVNKVYETYDNLGNMFTITYKGDKKVCLLNTWEDANGVFHFVTKIGEDTSSLTDDINLTLDTTQYKSLKALTSTLKTYAEYAIDDSKAYNFRLKVTDMDLIDNISIKYVDEETDVFRVTAVYADIKSKLDVNSQLVEVSSYDKTLGELPNCEYTTLKGGVQGESPASWVSFFDMLSNYDIGYIVPLTPDATIHAELSSHVSSMSGNLGRERRAIVGGYNDETVAETVERAKYLESDRIQVVHGGFYDLNDSNELQLYAPYILAAQHAGRAAYLDGGDNCGEPATHDVYRMSVPEYKLERDEIKQLLAGGCLAFEFVLGKNSTSQSYVRLVQDLTTDLTNEDTVHRERATGALADSINQEIREKCEEILTGKRTAVTDLTTVKNAVLTILQNRQRKGQIIDYQDVIVTKSGTVTNIDYYVAPAEPNNFTLITAHYYSESISAE